MEIKLYGWSKEPINVETLEIHTDMPGFVWLRMVDKNGKKYETACLKEVV